MSDQPIFRTIGDMVTDISAVTDLPGFGHYGDGNDGDLHVTSSTTLSADKNYNSILIDAGAVLHPANFRCNVKTRIVNNGTIDVSGGAAVADAGGVAVVAGTLGAGVDGAAGNATTVGTAGTAVAKSMGGSGGAGGNAVAHNGAAGGAATSIETADTMSCHSPAVLLKGGPLTSTDKIGGGASGGSGGSDGAQLSGGGGAGGGVMIIAAREIDNTNGIIQAKGGNGGAAANAGTGSGGGGGGGGGFIGIITQRYTGTLPNVAGGLGGAKHGTGLNGVAGVAGTVIILPM